MGVRDGYPGSGVPCERGCDHGVRWVEGFDSGWKGGRSGFCAGAGENAVQARLAVGLMCAVTRS